MARLSAKELADRFAIARSELPDVRAAALERRREERIAQEQRKLVTVQTVMPWKAELRAKAMQVPGNQSNRAGILVRSW